MNENIIKLLTIKCSYFHSDNTIKKYEKIDAVVIGNEEGRYHDRYKNRMIQTFHSIYENTYSGLTKTY